MDKRELIEVFEDAMKRKVPVSLYVEMPGFEEPEMITNPVANLEKKMAWYLQMYDDNLEHKHSKGVKIVGYKEQASYHTISVKLDLDTTDLDEAIKKINKLYDRASAMPVLGVGGIR